MKVLTYTNEKGGVGKTFLAVQTAFYAAYEFGLRVVVLDLDAQANATKTLINSKNPVVYVSKTPSSDLFELDTSIALSGLINSLLMLIPAPEDRTILQDVLNKDLQQAATSFQRSIRTLEKVCDLLIIDCNPNADIRSNCALSVASTIICPFQLLGESIDGLAGTVERVKAINRSADLYFIPNMVDASPLQQKKATDLIKFNAEMLLKIQSYKALSPNTNIYEIDFDSEFPTMYKFDPLVIEPQFSETLQEPAAKSITLVREAGLFAAIKRRNCFAVAQDESKPIWLTKNNERGWSELRRVLFTIIEVLDIDRDYYPTRDMERSLSSLQQIYPNHWKLLLRQYWMTNAVQLLPNLRKVDLLNLAQLKEHVPLSLIS